MESSLMGGSFSRIVKKLDLFSPKIRDFLGVAYFENFFSFWSWVGTSWVSFPIYVILYFTGYSFRVVTIALFVGEFLNHSILIPSRYVVKRDRPTPFPENHIVWDPWNRYSFPSAHASRSAMIAVILLQLTSVPTFLLIILPLSMGCTRLYLQKHYVSDILAGFLLGGISGWIAVALT